MKRLLHAIISTLMLTACMKITKVGDDGLSARKIDMSVSEQTSPVPDTDEPNSCKDLELSGTQVDVDVFPVRQSSKFMVYSCRTIAISIAPSVVINRRFIHFSLSDISQVSCDVALPSDARLKIQDAQQANVKMILRGADLEVTNTTQVNATLAFAEGQRYRFEVSAIQLTNFSSCQAFATTDSSAPKITIRANAQANVRCVSKATATWEDPSLTDPDGIPLHTD